MAIYLTLFVTAFLSALAITPRIVQTCRRLQLLDQPEDRKVHRTPVPRLGGIAIAFGLATALGAATVIDAQAALGLHADLRSLLPTVAAAMLVFGVGVWDDLEPVRPGVKLLVELAAASIVIASGLTISRVTMFGTDS